MPDPASSLPFPTAVAWVQSVLSPRLQPGHVVVDATAGNGHDTLFLTRQVLPGGHVYACDLQESAIVSTRARLLSHEVSEQDFTLIQSSHHELEQHLPAALRGHIQSFMFNLGYLPGGEKALITCTESTLQALAFAFEWLAESGVLSIVAYPGHEGGHQEAAAVEAWSSGLSPNDCEVQKMAFLNYRPTTPFGIVIRKRRWEPKNRD
jgi:hypothetical protein